MQNGGSRATPAASNHHVARLVFQSASVLIAGSVWPSFALAMRLGCALIAALLLEAEGLTSVMTTLKSWGQLVMRFW